MEFELNVSQVPHWQSEVSYTLTYGLFHFQTYRLFHNLKRQMNYSTFESNHRPPQTANILYKNKLKSAELQNSLKLDFEP